MPPDPAYLKALEQEWETRKPAQPLRRLLRSALIVLLMPVVPIVFVRWNGPLIRQTIIAAAALLAFGAITAVLLNRAGRGRARAKRRREKIALLAFFASQGLVMLYISASLLASALGLIAPFATGAAAPYVTLAIVVIYLLAVIALLATAPRIVHTNIRSRTDPQVKPRLTQRAFTTIALVLGGAAGAAYLLAGSGLPIGQLMLIGFACFAALFLLPVGLLVLSQVLTMGRAGIAAARAGRGGVE
ncbi:MAG: hypothetical protein Kow00124_10740 [Anaerolineae bacterium]